MSVGARVMPSGASSDYVRGEFVITSAARITAIVCCATLVAAYSGPRRSLDDSIPGGGESPQPNIVIILADDLGYGDVGVYGHPSIRTPRLDDMARRGKKFTQFYAASSSCTPSRVALLTGRYAVRTGLTEDLTPNSSNGLLDEEVTIAEALRDVGYATAYIGKWHLGFQDRYLPLNHGFDRYFGIPYSNDMSPETRPEDAAFAGSPPTPVIRDFTVTNPNEEPDQRFLTRRYTEESVAFIREHAGNQPFFLYLAHTMPHVPLFASPEFEGTSLGGLYGDVVEELDWSVGQILDTLAELGIEDRTIVVFTSDNGPNLSQGIQGGSSGLFFGGKSSTFEGGYRVPAIFLWPGKIPAGVTTSAFATTMDLFTTSLSLAGARIPQDRVIDGQDLSSVLFESHPGREPAIDYYFGDAIWGVRRGPWKAHFRTIVFGLASELGEFTIEEHDPPLLYNVQLDPGELYNVSERNIDIVDQLTNVIQDPGEPETDGEGESVSEGEGESMSGGEGEPMSDGEVDFEGRFGCFNLPSKRGFSAVDGGWILAIVAAPTVWRRNRKRVH